MTNPPDVSEIGLSPGDRERLVASVMQRIEARRASPATVLATVGTWALPAGSLAAAALVAGIVAISVSRPPTPPVAAAAVAGGSFEQWVQTGQRPSAAEVMAVLVAEEADGPQD